MPGWPEAESWQAPLRAAAADPAAFAAAARTLSPKAIYLALWAQLYRRPVLQWCRHHSGRRRWLPTGGEEWGKLASARDPTAAFHILRLLGGGLRGAAKRRPWQDRLEDSCHGCGLPGVAIRWTTRTRLHLGLGWCSACLAPGGLSPDLWMAAISDEEAGNPSTAARRAGLAIPGTALDLPTLPGAFAPCPLCLRGEAGAEHLLTWCPATHHAWDLLGHPAGLASPRRLLTAPAWDPTAVAFLHQVSFLHTSLAGRAGMAWRTAGALLARAVRGRLAPLRALAMAEDDAASDEEWAGDAVPLRAPEQWGGWTVSPRLPCPACQAARRFPASFTQLPGGAAASEAWRRQACCTDSLVAQGSRAATLFGAGPRGSWPLSTARWWPPPGRVPAAHATAAWATAQCRACLQWQASLVALRALPRGTALTVALDLPLPYVDPDSPPAFTLTFDGSHGTGPSGLTLAGAAAVLRGPVGAGLDRPTIEVYQARVHAGSGLEAEALACAGGLDLLTHLPNPGYCLVVGDSPAIIGLGAGAAHIRRVESALPVVQAVGRALARGWQLGWERIPREFNQVADQRARAAAGLPPRRAAARRQPATPGP